MMNNIVKVNCRAFSNPWMDWRDVEINLDEYSFFEIDYRGPDSWHIIGHKCDSEYNWNSINLSNAQVSRIDDLAKFIAYANVYARKKSEIFQACKVSRFNNLHYTGSFYGDLQILLNLVKEYENNL